MADCISSILYVVKSQLRSHWAHLGEPSSAPRLAPARGPPLWELPASEQAEREIDPLAQPTPDYEFDQRVAW